MASTIECETLLQIEDSLVYNILLSLPIRAGVCPPDLPSTFHVWSVCMCGIQLGIQAVVSAQSMMVLPGADGVVSPLR